MNDREKRGVVSPVTMRVSTQSPRRGDAHKTMHIKQSPPSCPECGGRLIRMGYCFSCLNCGWGGCS